MINQDISLEYREQRETIQQLLRPQPTVIGIEGGPCSGKTTLISRLMENAGDRKVVCLPEAATEHILQLAEQGIDVSNLEKNDRAAWVAFEKAVLKTIVSDIETACDIYAGTDTVIIADRCDIGAYVTPDEYSVIQTELGLDMPPMLSHVDQLFFLPSVARIDPAIYESERTGNLARLESLEKAQAVCQRNLEAVGRHPELHIAWGGEFTKTIERLASSVLDPEGESEIKLKPRLEEGTVQAFFQEGDTVSVAGIEQTYYELDGTVFRLRQTVTDHGEQVYSFTVKHGEGMHRREIQRRIDRETFTLLGQCPRVGEPLLKERSTVLMDDADNKKRVWALDRYYDRRLPEWNIETDVESDPEAELIRVSMPEFEPALLGAEKLARGLGARALRV